MEIPEKNRQLLMQKLLDAVKQGSFSSFKNCLKSLSLN